MITVVKTTLCLCLFKAISENEVCDCNDCTESFYYQHVISYCWIFPPRNRPFWIENKMILLGVKCKNIILTCIGEQKVITGLYPCLYSNICIAKYSRILFVSLGTITGTPRPSLKNMKIISDIDYIRFHGLHWIMTELRTITIS